MSQEHQIFPNPDWTADTAETLVMAMESQYLAALDCEYEYDIYNSSQDEADKTLQKRLNEEYRLDHPTEPDANDIQHWYDIYEDEDNE